VVLFLTIAHLGFASLLQGQIKIPWREGLFTCVTFSYFFFSFVLTHHITPIARHIILFKYLALTLLVIVATLTLAL